MSTEQQFQTFQPPGNTRRVDPRVEDFDLAVLGGKPIPKRFLALDDNDELHVDLPGRPVYTVPHRVATFFQVRDIPIPQIRRILN
jgi:hypothetical protein